MLVAALVAPVLGFGVGADAAPSNGHRQGRAHHGAARGAYQHRRDGGTNVRRSSHGHASARAREHHRPVETAGVPEATWSRYMHTVDPRRVRRLGCELGARVRAGQETDNALVVLAFGMPMHHTGRFGASLFGSFANSKKIGAASVSYARGYEGCVGKSPGHLTLSVGTSNYGSDVTFRHGRIWGAMVNRANHALRSWGLGHAVSIVGGNDIEPGWRGPDTTRRWIRGYKSATRTPYYNFGGAAGCPPIGFCQGDWTMEDIWYAAWGSGVAVPLPEIYSRTGSNAEQWYRLSLYSYKAHGRRMEIAGAMSQLQSCWDSHDRCLGIRNPPNKAWSQLWHALNSDPRTAQPLPYLTNITWQN